MSKAQQLEMVKMNRFGSGGIGAPSKENSLTDAAELYLLMGNIQKYCELKVELGKWQDALVVAPGVSHNYWKTLLQKYTDSLLEKNSLQSVPYLVATDRKKELVKVLQKNGQLGEALTVASSSWHIAGTCSCVTNNSVDNASGDAKTYDLLEESVDSLAKMMLNDGKPIQAVCYYLCINNIQEAIRTLIRGHEIEMAVTVCKMQLVKGPLAQAAVKYLAWKCVKSGNWELASDILLTLSETDENSKAQLCVHCPFSFPERSLLLSKAGFPSAEDCLSYAQEAKNENKILHSITYYLLSNEPETGLEIGLNFVRGIMNKEDWKLKDVSETIKLMAYIRTEVLQNETCKSLTHELQLYAAYLGALEAIYRHFKPIVEPLFLHACKYQNKLSDFVLPLTAEQLKSELHAWTVFQKSRQLSEEQQQTYEELMSKVKDFECDGECGETLVTGSNLPRHSDQHRSYFTNHTIKGPVFFLEDDQTAISLNDALMWAKVNPFSPLETHQLINPF